MKIIGLPLLVLLVISAVGLPFTYISYTVWGSSSKQNFFFGVSYGGNTTAGAELLIDKVQGYTNLLIVNSYAISTNEAMLDEVCNYAAAANLHFIVYFFSVYNSTWQQEWVDKAEQRWNNKFLGVYLRDEHGGRQIDLSETVTNASNYSDAANSFVEAMASTFSMKTLNSKGVPVFTSDYALYWYDYLAGYSTVFVELGWNNSRTQQIALCRGAANAQGKGWGAIIVWTYMQPPYIASGPEILQDMHMAYNAGAKYVVVFDYPTHPENNQYGILTDDHFAAMQQFWSYVQSFPKGANKVAGQTAFVLPKDYGGGLRRADDNIWGLWPADAQSRLIWENMNKLSERHGLKLDIVYDGDRVNLIKRYTNVYLWNGIIN